MFQKKPFLLFLGSYAALRLFSYFFGPETPLKAQHPLNSLMTLVILLLTIYWLNKKDIRGWYVVALEILLGGSGGFFSFFHLALRTWLLIVSLGIFAMQKIKEKKLRAMLRENSIVSSILGSLFVVVILQALHGYLNGHDLHLVIADTVPYLFFAYYFPLREIVDDKNFRNLALNALAAAILGNALFILITFAGFSSGIFQLQDNYYHWFRDVAEGKITELPFHFYRLVLNEQLLLVPILLYFITKIIKKKISGIYIILPVLLLVVLSVNLTRIYLVGLIVGLLVLFRPAEWQRWLTVSLLTALFFFASFTAIHLIASRGASLGWEIFGLRLQSIVTPELENSSLSRILLLPKILEKIGQHPLLGAGFGDTVTIFSPVFKQTMTTPYFDWGYLEILDGLGVFGFLIWLAPIGYLFIRYKKSQSFDWPMAGLLSLLIINLTSPALFHVLGVLLITTLLSFKTEGDTFSIDTQNKKSLL